MTAARSWHRLHASTWLLVVALSIGFAMANRIPRERPRWSARGPMPAYGRAVTRDAILWTGDTIRDYGWPLCYLRKVAYGDDPAGAFLPSGDGVVGGPLTIDLAIALSAVAAMAGLHEASRRKARRWAQFSTRGALALFSLVAVGVGWWSQPIRRDEAFRANLEGLDFQTQLAAASPPGAVSGIASRFGVSSTPAYRYRIALPRDDDGWTKLHRLLAIDPDRVLLEIPTGMSLEERRRLKSLAGLRHLYLGMAHDDNLACLQEAAELRSLTVRGPAVTFGPQMTDRGLEVLGRLPNLRVLRVENYGLDDGRVGTLCRILAGVPSLERWEFENASFRGTGWTHLAALRRLDCLIVDGAAPVSLRALDVAAADRLRFLKIEGSRPLTPEVDALRRRAPGLTIVE